jgi:hypothetical protein
LFGLKPNPFQKSFNENVNEAERKEIMNARYLKTVAFVLALLFLSSCEVFLRDDDEFHRHRASKGDIMLERRK